MGCGCWLVGGCDVVCGCCLVGGCVSVGGCDPVVSFGAAVCRPCVVDVCRRCSAAVCVGGCHRRRLWRQCVRRSCGWLVFRVWRWVRTKSFVPLFLFPFVVCSDRRSVIS